MSEFEGPDLAKKGGEGTEPGVPVLPEMLKELANHRQLLQFAIKRKEQFLANDEYQKILDEIADMKALIQVDEKLVRSIAMDYFKETGDKHPHVKVEIKEVTVCRYEIPPAEEWCKTNLPQAFDWNQHFFEKHAIAVQNTAPVPGVEIIKDPMATIAQDLTGLIPNITDVDVIPF